MANKKNVQSMTPQELAAYVEAVRDRNRLNAKNYYDNKIKTNPEKYDKFKEKCAKASKTYYSHTRRFLLAEEASERVHFEF